MEQNYFGNETEVNNKDPEVIRGAQLLGKGIGILFWLFIPSALAEILSNETLIEWMPGLYRPGIILQIVCLFIYNFVLLKISSAERHYRTAGICGMVSVIVTLPTLFFPGSGDSAGWTMFLGFPAAVAALIGEYNEYRGHAAVLMGVDIILSEKWRSLWRWYIGMFAVAIGSVFFMVFSLVIGLIVAITALIGLLVVAVMRLICLYRTAKIFRNLSNM